MTKILDIRKNNIFFDFKSIFTKLLYIATYEKKSIISASKKEQNNNMLIINSENNKNFINNQKKPLSLKLIKKLFSVVEKKENQSDPFMEIEALINSLLNIILKNIDNANALSLIISKKWFNIIKTEKTENLQKPINLTCQLLNIIDQYNPSNIMLIDKLFDIREKNILPDFNATFKKLLDIIKNAQ